MELRNNNRDVIRYLAEETGRRGKGESRILTCAAAFAVILVFCVFSFAAGKLEAQELENIRSWGMANVYSLENPTERQQETIKKLPYIRYAGRVRHFAAAEKNGTPVFFCTCFTEKTFEMVYRPAFTDVAGSFPQEAGQIMLPKEALENLDIKEPKLGMKLQLTIASQNREGKKAGAAREETFTLSGYFTDYRGLHTTNEVPNAVFSDEYLRRHPQKLLSCQLQILPRQILYDRDKQKRQEDQLKKDARIGEGQQLEGYFTPVDRTELIRAFLEAGSISFFALLLAGLLIRNVTGISLHNSIRHYGMLKTLGATKRQIRSILRRQAVKPALSGVLIGGAAGALLVWLLFPALLENLYLRDCGTADGLPGLHPELLAASVLLVFAVVMESAMSPARKISRLSPLETQIWRSRSSGNRKKNVFVVLTMSMGILAGLVSAAMVAGFDNKEAIEEEPDFSIFAWEYQMDLTEDTAKKEIALLDKRTEAQIRGIPGVTSACLTCVDYLFLNGKEAVWKLLAQEQKIYGSALLADEGCLNRLEKYAQGKGRSLDFAGVRAGKGAIALHANELSAGQEQEADALIGRTFELAGAGGEQRGSFLFSGYLNRAEKEFPKLRLPMHSAHQPILLMTEEGFRRAGLRPNIQDMELTVEPKQEPSVKKGLEEILKKRNRVLWKETGIRGCLELSVKSGAREENWARMAAMRLMAYGITVLLGLLGLLNYVNTVIMDLLSRRRELALLECAGMTKAQMRRMLIKEGLGFGLSTIALSGAAGAVLLPAAVRIVRLKYYTFPFAWPLAELAVMSALLLICSIWLPLMVYERQRKETIAERLRHAGQ